MNKVWNRLPQDLLHRKRNYILWISYNIYKTYIQHIYNLYIYGRFLILGNSEGKKSKKLSISREKIPQNSWYSTWLQQNILENKKSQKIRGENREKFHQKWIKLGQKVDKIVNVNKIFSLKFCGGKNPNLSIKNLEYMQMILLFIHSFDLK